MTPDFMPSPQLYPFRSRGAETSAGRVHYVDEGKGRPLVLLHGDPAWSFLYRNLIQALQGDFTMRRPRLSRIRPVRPARAGYAYTHTDHAAVVGELVDQLGLHGLIVMGHDWGGPIGLSVAAARAERVAGLILGNTWFWPSELRTRIFSTVMSSRPMQRAIGERNLFVERLIPSGVVRTLSDDEVEHYRGVQARPEHAVGSPSSPARSSPPLRGWPSWKAPYPPPGRQAGAGDLARARRRLSGQAHPASFARRLPGRDRRRAPPSQALLP